MIKGRLVMCSGVIMFEETHDNQRDNHHDQPHQQDTATYLDLKHVQATTSLVCRCSNNKCRDNDKNRHDRNNTGKNDNDDHPTEHLPAYNVQSTHSTSLVVLSYSVLSTVSSDQVQLMLIR